MRGARQTLTARRAFLLFTAMVLPLGLPVAKAGPFVPWDALTSNSWIHILPTDPLIHMYTANAGAYQVGFDGPNGAGAAKGENALQFSYGGVKTGHMTSSQLTGSFGVYDSASGGGPTFPALLILVAINAPSLGPDFSFSLGTGGNNYQFHEANDFAYYSHPEYATGRPSGYYNVTSPQGEGISYDFSSGMVSVYAAQGLSLGAGQTVTFDYSFANLPGEAVFSVYGYDPAFDLIHHTNRSVTDAASPSGAVSTFAVVPEPGTLALLLYGAACAGRRRWRLG